MIGWTELPDTEYGMAWDRFHENFRFNPSTESIDWPAIIEPADSVTFSIAHIYDGDTAAYNRRTVDLGRKLISAFRMCTAPTESIYALDWQHACYRFEPHSEFEFVTEEDWPVPPLPNGDYYIFLSQDMKLGVFGHPWEQTICVFGQPLISAFSVNPPELFCKTLRVSGHAA